MSLAAGGIVLAIGPAAEAKLRSGRIACKSGAGIEEHQGSEKYASISFHGVLLCCMWYYDRKKIVLQMNENINGITSRMPRE